MLYVRREAVLDEKETQRIAKLKPEQQRAYEPVLMAARIELAGFKRGESIEGARVPVFYCGTNRCGDISRSYLKLTLRFDPGFIQELRPRFTFPIADVFRSDASELSAPLEGFQNDLKERFEREYENFRNSKELSPDFNNFLVERVQTYVKGQFKIANFGGIYLSKNDRYYNVVYQEADKALADWATDTKRKIVEREGLVTPSCEMRKRMYSLNRAALIIKDNPTFMEDVEYDPDDLSLSRQVIKDNLPLIEEKHLTQLADECFEAGRNVQAKRLFKQAIRA